MPKLKNHEIDVVFSESLEEKYGPHLKDTLPFDDVIGNDKWSKELVVKELTRLYSLKRYWFVQRGEDFIVYDTFKKSSWPVIDADFEPTIQENILGCIFNLDGKESLYSYLKSLKQ